MQLTAPVTFSRMKVRWHSTRYITCTDCRRYYNTDPSYEGHIDSACGNWGLCEWLDLWSESRKQLTVAKVSIQFGAFHWARRQLEISNAKSNPIDPSLSYGQYYLAGAFAGVSNSIISGPIEHVRIRLQTQPHGSARLYQGPVDCIRKVIAHNGVLKGLYRGEAVTVIREAQAYGVWFLIFEYMMRSDARRNKVKREEISNYKVAGYGGLAGEALWLASYPFDVVKSKMQTDGFGKYMRYRSMRDCFAQTWRVEGLRGFWKGIVPTLLRAMPVSAGTFAVFVSVKWANK